MRTNQVAKQARTILRDGVNSVRRNLTENKQKLALIKANETSLTVLMMVILDKLGKLAKGTDAYINSVLDWSTNKMVPKVTFYVSGADGFKSPEVVGVLEFLTREFEECTSNDHSGSLGRSYSFIRPDMRVECVIYVSEDSPTCRRVEIGEEIVVQKKYKIECD